MPQLKYLRPALATSMVAHVLGLVALGAWSYDALTSQVRLAGQDQVIELTVSTVEPQWHPEPLVLEQDSYDEQVVIHPTEARIAKRRFVHTPASDLTAADLSLDLPLEVLSPVSPRSENNDLPDPAAREQVDGRPDQSIPTRTITVPQLPDTAVVEPPSNLGNTPDIPPDLSRNAPPTYPSLAVQRRWQGTVLLRVWIDEQGRVTNLEVARSSGHPILDAAAANAVRRWTATPARQGSKAVPTVELLPVRFRL